MAIIAGGEMRRSLSSNMSDLGLDARVDLNNAFVINRLQQGWKLKFNIKEAS
jgi:hypothetical protein